MISPCIFVGQSGGSIVTSNGAQLVATTSGGTLNDVTFSGDMLIGQTLYNYIYVTAGLTLNNNATITMEGNWAFGFRQYRNSWRSGTGNFADNLGYVKGLFVPNAGTTLTIGSNILVHGISGDVGVGAGSLSNLGTIAADGGGTITVHNDTNYVGGTLTDGTWEVSNNSTLELIVSITTNRQQVADGAVSSTRTPARASALTGFATNVVGGTFTIQNEANFHHGSLLQQRGLGGHRQWQQLPPWAEPARATVQTGGETVLDSGTLGALVDFNRHCQW